MSETDPSKLARLLRDGYSINAVERRALANGYGVLEREIEQLREAGQQIVSDFYTHDLVFKQAVEAMEAALARKGGGP